MNIIEEETHPFKPYVPLNAQVLMLGTFPPAPNRWSMEFYYPNKINDMWRIMGMVFYDDKDRFWDASLGAFKLSEIKVFLEEKRIALYDTGVKVKRLKGNASDKFLEIIEPIDIFSFLRSTPTINALITTGEKASQTLARITGTESPGLGKSVSFNFNGKEIRHYRLPSTSRAYPLSIYKKADEYSKIFSSEGYNIIKKNI